MVVVVEVVEAEEDVVVREELEVVELDVVVAVKEPVDVVVEEVVDEFDE